MAALSRHGGRTAELPGIGAYTAAAVAAIAFNQKAAAVDGNVERVVSRLFMVEEPLPKAKPLIRALTEAIWCPADRPGDFAQAIMDLGATICTPKRPACALCPWMVPCRARAEGCRRLFPKKQKKETGQLRRGAAFVVLRADDSDPAAHPPAAGAPRRHGGAADQRVGARLRTLPRHARRPHRGALAAPARHRPPRLHPFPARTDGALRQGAARNARSRATCAGPCGATCTRRRCRAR